MFVNAEIHFEPRSGEEDKKSVWTSYMQKTLLPTKFRFSRFPSALPPAAARAWRASLVFSVALPSPSPPFFKREIYMRGEKVGSTFRERDY